MHPPPLFFNKLHVYLAHANTHTHTRAVSIPHGPLLNRKSPETIASQDMLLVTRIDRNMSEGERDLRSSGELKRRRVRGGRVSKNQDKCRVVRTVENVTKLSSHPKQKAERRTDQPTFDSALHILDVQANLFVL